MRTLVLLAIVHTSVITAAQANDGTDKSPLAYALQFFDRLPRGNVDTALRAIRPHAVTVAERRRVRAMLPAEGDVTPTPREAMMLDALRTVLVYHQRHDVFEIKVIDIPQAYVGLHGRAILLISRQALRLLSALELQAVVAHEIGHDFLWGEFQLALKDGDLQLRQQLELQCDGVAVLTLIALEMDPLRLNAGVRKLTRYNEMLGASDDAGKYPSPTDRKLLVSILLGVGTSADSSRQGCTGTTTRWPEPASSAISADLIPSARPRHRTATSGDDALP